MNIRFAKKEDLPEIIKLCENENIDPQKLGYCIVAEYNGEIVGFANMVSVPIIETMITKAPMVSRRLYDNLIGSLMTNGSKSVIIYTDRKENKELYNHLGFTEFQNTYSIFRKEL